MIRAKRKCFIIGMTDVITLAIFKYLQISLKAEHELTSFENKLFLNVFIGLGGIALLSLLIFASLPSQKNTKKK